ncbi:MAG: hypothetical protein U1F77_19320 [Kiritimatiellia bacterium]
MDHTIPQPAWKDRIRGHVTGPVGSILFHILLIFGMVRYLTGNPEIMARQTPVEIKLEAKPLELEIIQDIKEIWVTEEVRDVDMSVPSDTPALEAATPSDTPSPTPGEAPADLEDLKVISNVESLVSISGISRGKGGGGFGYNQRVRGDLVGTMYDLKRNAAGGARAPDYLNDLRSIIDGRLSARAFGQFYRATNQLYSTHLYFPKQSADNGPAAFGAEKEVKPSNWIVHYSGMIKAPEADRYRFVGMFDDLLMVFIDGRIALEFLWTGDPTPWAPAEFADRHMCFAGRPLVYGDWLKMNPQQAHRIDVLVGEHPGGLVGGTLMIQQERRKYSLESNGRPILPVFTVQRLTYPERKALEDNPDWKFDFPPPVFNAFPAGDAYAKPNDDDIQVKL